MRSIVIAMLFLCGCSVKNSDVLETSSKDYSLRKKANTTTFLSSILYYNPNSAILSNADKKSLDQVIAFEEKYPSVIKTVSYSASATSSKSRNEMIRKYLETKIDPKQLSFEIGNKDEIIVNPNTLKKDTSFSNRSEIYISY
ncbi:MAG: hypothetical protein LBR35_02515 [Rickettsiales bacterium]|jgi:hypothetical protein|nr:hypothetical protein [Rickettsiales bacterium]